MNYSVCLNLYPSLFLNSYQMVNQQFDGEEHAQIYSLYRPDIPSDIAQKSVEFLKKKFDGTLEVAVDVGCGCGQSSVILAPFFSRVRGLDVSEAQIQEAKKHRVYSNVEYSVQEAETLPFENGSVQLVTAGASLHWFDLEVFFREVRRILTPGGVFVAYTYHSLRPLLECPLRMKEVDAIYKQIYDDLYPYWPPEAHSSLEKYKSVHFPFEEVLRIPDIRQMFNGKLSDLVGFIESMSSFQIMKKKDSNEAESFIHQFRVKLREILMVSDDSQDPEIRLYRDFYCILCRKGQEY
ncbi:methyltransferase DDB_G0268948 [Trichonephila inaurata madagascariensis]|uniref:Methyltransferase DDB_G0268948 n=1 Tax=Trichonephila inaurata madagascariensis TaxID=2747483 RepID=A0A8X6K8B7_9ARAC|nr:methyltransferase DDB_G0268948 [Trichonephila inaurata madagascariensis]